jgi:hypothetical protein
MGLRKPSLSTVIASLALFFALGGTAIAAHHYLIRSTSQIKPSVISALKGKNGASGAQGPQGPAGPPGPAGAQGASGVASLSGLTLVEGEVERVPAEKELGPEEIEGAEGSVATCPPGDNVVSGGSDIFTGVVAATLSVPSEDHHSWIIVVANASTFNQGEVVALAYCAGAGKAIAARSPGAAHLRARKEKTRLLAKMATRLRASKE